MPRCSSAVRLALPTLLLAVLLPGTLRAANDTPTLSVVSFGTHKIELEITAGASGTPGGFSVYWMTRQDYEDYGSVWPDLLTYPGLHWANFTGVPTLNTGDGLYTTFQLAPFQTVRVEIGDLADESGVSTNTPEELELSEIFAVCVFANGGAGQGRSGYSETVEGTTLHKKDDCVHSQGYWKNHPGEWPVTSLTLGTITYTQSQLLQILNRPVQGNGLVSMSKQLIAALLNVANGADPAPIATRLGQAHALIGTRVVPPIGSGHLAPSLTSATTQVLDDFNNGKIDTVCEDPTRTASSTWGRIKSLYR